MTSNVLVCDDRSFHVQKGYGSVSTAAEDFPSHAVAGRHRSHHAGTCIWSPHTFYACNMFFVIPLYLCSCTRTCTSTSECTCTTRGCVLRGSRVFAIDAEPGFADDADAPVSSDALPAALSDGARHLAAV